MLYSNALRGLKARPYRPASAEATAAAVPVLATVYRRSGLSCVHGALESDVRPSKFFTRALESLGRPGAWPLKDEADESSIKYKF